MNIENIYQSNGWLCATIDGVPMALNEAQYPELYAAVTEYLEEHPDAFQDAPSPPKLTDEQLEAQAEAQRQALFAAYDTAIMQLRRHERLGDETATAKIAEWDAYATALEAINDTPEWYLNPQWPEKPE